MSTKEIEIKVGDEIEIMGEFADSSGFFVRFINKPMKVVVREILQTDLQTLISVNYRGIHHTTFNKADLRESMVKANPTKFYEKLDSVTL